MVMVVVVVEHLQMEVNGQDNTRNPGGGGAGTSMVYRGVQSFIVQIIPVLAIALAASNETGHTGNGGRTNRIGGNGANGIVIIRYRKENGGTISKVQDIYPHLYSGRKL